MQTTIIYLGKQEGTMISCERKVEPLLLNKNSSHGVILWDEMWRMNDGEPELSCFYFDYSRLEEESNNRRWNLFNLFGIKGSYYLGIQTK